MANDSATAILVVLWNLKAIFRLLEMRKRIGGKFPTGPEAIEQPRHKSFDRPFRVQNEEHGARLDGRRENWMAPMTIG
jgi:hypothetical protein